MRRDRDRSFDQELRERFRGQDEPGVEELRIPLGRMKRRDAVERGREARASVVVVLASTVAVAAVVAFAVAVIVVRRPVVVHPTANATPGLAQATSSAATPAGLPAVRCFTGPAGVDATSGGSAVTPAASVTCFTSTSPASPVEQCTTTSATSTATMYTCVPVIETASTGQNCSYSETPWTAPTGFTCSFSESAGMAVVAYTCASSSTSSTPPTPPTAAAAICTMTTPSESPTPVPGRCYATVESRVTVTRCFIDQTRTPAPAAPPSCSSGQLTLTLDGVQGATQNVVLVWHVTNTAATCTLGSRLPTVVFSDGKRSVEAFSYVQPAGSSRPFIITSGASVRLSGWWSGWCASWKPTRAALSFPSGARLSAALLQGAGSVEWKTRPYAPVNCHSHGPASSATIGFDGPAPPTP